MKNLFEAVELFEKLATGDHSSLINGHKQALQGEIAGGVRACNKLMTTNPAAAASEGMQTLDEIFGILGGQVANLQPDNLDSITSEMSSTVAKGMFYASTGNAGTGYDPITETGGAWSPAAYLNRISTHVQALKSLVGAPAPTQPTDII